MRIFICLFLACAQALAGEVDSRVRSYVLPTRIVWTSPEAANGKSHVRNAESLLTPKYGQVPEKRWLTPSGCTLVNDGATPGVVLDFGRELHGGLQVANSDKMRGLKVRIRFGESLGETMSGIGEKGATNDHAVRDDVYELPFLGNLEIGNTGFRFVRIDLVTPGQVTLEGVRAISLMRSMTRVGSFKSSDERLNQVWETAVRTVHLCCQDFLWDGIKRDRLVWTGDLHPETRAILSVFGAAEILPASLDYAAAITPTDSWMHGMANYTLWFLRNVYEWYFYTGDVDYLKNRRDYLRQTIELVLAHAFGEDAAFVKHGFLDWPTEHNKLAVDAGTRGLLATTLDQAARMMDVTGDSELAARCRATAKKVRLEKPDAHGAKSAAALLALGGLRDAKEMYRDVLSKNGLQGISTFYGYYMLEAMSAAGEHQRALDTVRDYWGAMLDMGATSFWEDFNVAWTNNATRIDEMPVDGKIDIHGDFGDFCYQGYRHSLCHGWSAGPAAWCINHILGLEALDVGARTVRVKPFLGDLQWAEGALPTPHGPVRVRHEKQPDGSIKTTIDAPPGVRIIRDSSPLEKEPWIGDGRSVFTEEADFYGEDPAPEFRAEVVLPPDGDVTVEVACAGYFRLRLNARAPRAEPAMMPLWSPFDQTIYTERLTFDASARNPHPEKNVLSITLGNGFYNLPPMKFWGRRNFRAFLAHGRPSFKLKVNGVDEPLKWEWRRTPIIRNCVYLGEEVDGARADDQEWKPAVEVAGPKGYLVPRTVSAMRLGDAIPGKARWLKKGEVQVVDFGANRTGVPVFSFTQPAAGSPIEIVYGERLNPDGSVNVLTQTAGQVKYGNGGPGAPHVACQRDVFVPGAGVQVFSPTFAWHIFRYAEVRGYDRLLDTPSAAQFLPLDPGFRDTPRAASFKTSNKDLEKIHEICRRTFLANAIGGVQSDCPGRERLGYGGDIVATCEAYMLNWDMREFYLKTLQDFADEAAEDGWLTETAPHVGIAVGGFGGRSGPISWTVVVPVLMDALIRHYPDVKDRALMFYPVCARYVRLVDGKCPSGIVPHCIGDHEALERAPDDVTATAHWSQFVRLTAKFARMLGRTDDAKEFETLDAKIKAAFAAKFIKNGIVANGTQSAQAQALYLGLVPTDQIPAAEAALVKAIEEKGFAPSTGIFSTRYMLIYLSEHGRRDLAKKIVLHKGFPGWLHMIERGATTLWETWKESDNVYSNCHPMFGSVDEWILRFAEGDEGR